MATKKNKPVKQEAAAVVAAETTDIVNEMVEVVEEPVKQEAAAVVVPIPAVTSEVISSSATDPGEDSSLVAVLIKYPDGYKGRKILKQGQVYKVSAEAADIFIKKGIAEKV